MVYIDIYLENRIYKVLHWLGYFSFMHRGFIQILSNENFNQKFLNYPQLVFYLLLQNVVLNF